MGRLFRAARVFETAVSNVETSLLRGRPQVAPPWLRAVESIPPSEILTRPYPVQHTRPSRRLRKPHKTFRPTRLEFPEDELRRAFYRDHPWELARPKMVLELDGKDARYRDWSGGLLQPGMLLSGESVVQRQLWIMEHEPGVTRAQAYDRVRREFYQLRHEEEVELRIAQEEARMVGAYFGMSALRVGLQLEDEQYERWKGWAAQEISRIEAERSQAYTSFGDDAEVEAPEEQKMIS